MARYLLLTIEDDKEAAEVIKQLRQWKGIQVPDLTEDSTEDKLVPVVLRGVYAKPSNFCECVSGKGSFTRGRKLGWWVCSQCSKPSKGWANGDTWWIALGVNLLPISEDCPEWRGHNHANHPGYNPDNPIQKMLAARKE